MPYKIRKLPNKNEYEVYNRLTHKIHAKHSSLPNALAQLRILKNVGIKPSASLGLRNSNINNEISDKQIKDILKEKVIEVVPRDLLPKKLQNGWYIINLQSSSDGDGTHWTCFKYDSIYPLIYYDSMGFEPPIEVMEHGYNTIFYNNKQIQDYNSSACGYFCIDLILSDFNKKSSITSLNNFHDYLKMFSSNTIFNDSTLFNHLQLHQ
jgi:hypothetical protein